MYGTNVFQATKEVKQRSNEKSDSCGSSWRNLKCCYVEVVIVLSLLMSSGLFSVFLNVFQNIFKNEHILNCSANSHKHKQTTNGGKEGCSPSTMGASPSICLPQKQRTMETLLAFDFTEIISQSGFFFKFSNHDVCNKNSEVLT